LGIVFGNAAERLLLCWTCCRRVLRDGFTLVPLSIKAGEHHHLVGIVKHGHVRLDEVKAEIAQYLRHLGTFDPEVLG
jgi:hypothetical protein